MKFNSLAVTSQNKALMRLGQTLPHLYRLKCLNLQVTWQLQTTLYLWQNKNLTHVKAKQAVSFHCTQKHTHKNQPTAIQQLGLIYRWQTGSNHRCFTSCSAPSSIHKTDLSEILSLCMPSVLQAIKLQIMEVTHPALKGMTLCYAMQQRSFQSGHNLQFSSVMFLYL